MDFFLQLLVNGMSLGFLYALSALGFVMIFKSSSVLNFAHGELLAIGAFLFLVLSSWANLPIIIAFAFTLIGSFSLGFIIERFFLRRLIGEALIEVIMLTVGLAIMFKGLLLFIFGGDIRNYRHFLPEGLSITWGSIGIPSVYVASFVIGILFLILFGFFFKYSSQGIYMRSVADNQPAALSRYLDQISLDNPIRCVCHSSSPANKGGVRSGCLLCKKVRSRMFIIISGVGLVRA